MQTVPYLTGNEIIKEYMKQRRRVCVFCFIWHFLL